MSKKIVLNEVEQSMNTMYKSVMMEDSRHDILGSYAKLLSYREGEVVSFMESAAIDSMSGQLSKGFNTGLGIEDDIPSFTPFYNPDEYRALYPDRDISDYDYIIMQDPVAYKAALEAIWNNMRYFGNKEEREEKMRSLGWLPQAEPTLENFRYARERQIKWLKENKPSVQIVDVSKMEAVESLEETVIDTILEPVYICLVYGGNIFSDIINWWKKSKYSHAALSLDEKLNKMYSFNRNVQTGESGFFEEGIQDYKNPKKNGDADICVLVTFVTKEQKRKIREALDWYLKNKKYTSYSFKNIANIVFNHVEETRYSLQMVCSQFVDNILKIANIDITRKSNNLVSPEDFKYAASESNKCFIVYEGMKSTYKPSKVKAKVNSLLKVVTRKQLPRITAKEVATNMANPVIDSFLVECIDSADKQNILSEVVNILTPESIMVESKRVPIGFTKKGDIYIDAPKDLEAEYQEAHKLLSVYDEDNIQGIKHELARLFYIISIIDRRVSKMDDRNTVEYRDLIKLKARAMNDFTKYMKIVNRVEKNFDFTEYIKHTEYYDKTMIIGNDTLKYSGSYIKKALKLLNM